MANVILKTDFVDGEKLFAQQLNNNFSAIMAALAAMNKITWQDDPDDSVITFRGTTEEVNQREIIDGQLLYDTTTGETYIDYGSQRISTGSGNAIFIGDTVPTNPSTQLWIDPSEPIQTLGSEVTNTLDGDDINKSPSVAAVNIAIQEIYDYINRNTRKMFDYIEIPDNADINTYVQTGTYKSLTQAHSATLSGIPSEINGGFVLYVTGYTSTSSSTTYRRQELIFGNSTYIRTTTNGGSTWGSWYKLTSSSVPTKS